MSAPRTLRKLVDEELERRHEKHAAHCDGACFQGNDERMAATIAVALALIDERDAMRSVVERHGVALRVVALWLGGAHHHSQPDDVEELARAKSRELDALRAMVERKANDVVALRRDLEALRAAVREWADARGAWDAWPSGARGTATAVVHRLERSEDALRAIAKKDGAA